MSKKLLVIISILGFISLFLVLKGAQRSGTITNVEISNADTPQAKIEIINPDLSESVDEFFREVDTKILGHEATFDLFDPVDVDNDGIEEKIYYVPIAMNHGASEIWVIKDDRIIFKSNGKSDRWFEQAEDNNGFYLLEGIEVDHRWNAISRKTRYFYQDHKFIPIWYQDTNNQQEN